jgi:hypothetical protein
LLSSLLSDAEGSSAARAKRRETETSIREAVPGCLRVVAIRQEVVRLNSAEYARAG